MALCVNFVATGGEVNDALALEDIEFNKAVRDAATEAQAEINALEREMTAKRALFSGPRYVREMEIHFTKLADGTIEKAIAKRRQLGRNFPELLTPPHLNRLRDKLHRHVDAVLQGQRTRLEIGGGRLLGAALPGFSASINRQAEQKTYALKARVAQEIEILRLEARTGMHAEEKPVTFNISNSTIASLNLGTVVGDLMASVQILSTHDQKGIADAIQALAEAIAASAQLQGANQKELLEHLSLLSTEVALPPEKRRMGPLKSSIAFLREGLADVAQLAALWQSTEQILKSMGVLS
jgi:hypothetical protein